MQSVLVGFSQYQFVIAGAPSINPEVYHEITGGKIPVVQGQTYTLIENSLAALVTSGTASLETALLGTPQVICYKASPISYHIARQLVKIKYIGLPNLILDKPVVTELIQYHLNTGRLIKELDKLLHIETERKKMLADYHELRKALGGNGASAKTAEGIIRFLDTKN
jgi:lipid-A-disaccharide synthase